MFWKTMSKVEYIIQSLIIAILPFFSGLFVAVSPVWSDLWWKVDLFIITIWFLWAIIAALLGLQNSRMARVLPLNILLNVTFLLLMIALWRISEESTSLGVLLLISHLIATIFSFVFSKEIISRNFSDVSRLNRIGKYMILLLPIAWILTIFMQDIFVAKSVRAMGASIVGYYLNFYLMATSIQYRDPNWKPKKKVSL
ncbi:hypothetical protein [Shimazuella kribbensis]|uniref:hypothetical protein n=1 Tax=Shimazuella kribbensis TaxID=139808 RepID=UPI0012EC4101|nr:hypothetical protein [Shimazuella kribbensis]